MQCQTDCDTKQLIISYHLIHQRLLCFCLRATENSNFELFLQMLFIALLAKNRYWFFAEFYRFTVEANFKLFINKNLILNVNFKSYANSFICRLFKYTEVKGETSSIVFFVYTFSGAASSLSSFLLFFFDF